MYPVDLHMHTVASAHAYSTLHDYIVQAKMKNIRLFAITDHGPEMDDAPHYWHFMNMCVWPRMVDGVGILRGIESNIKNRQGEIDCTKIMIKQMDLVIAGFHESVLPPQDVATHTEALISTIVGGHVHIISHPGNPKYPIDISTVAKVAAHYNVALEINNSSFMYSRKGSGPNCRAIAEAVRDAGGKLALGSDSHVAFSLGDFSHCEHVLREINFPEEQVLNVSPRRVLDFLEQRGHPGIPEFGAM
ncbi:MAG: phosphatase [Candidatus Malihini olakiniferum]